MIVFDKFRMIERLKLDGRAAEITPGIGAIMDNLHGQPASANNWRRTVYGEPVMWVVGKNGTGEYVAEKDCCYSSELTKEGENSSAL